MKHLSLRTFSWALLLCAVTAQCRSSSAPPSLPGLGVTQEGEDHTPPAPVRRLKMGRYNAQNGVELNWLNPDDPDFASLLIVRFMGQRAPVAPQIEGKYAVDDRLAEGFVIYSGAPLRAWVDLPPDLTQTYTYQIWTRDEAGNWSQTAQSITIDLSHESSEHHFN